MVDELVQVFSKGVVVVAGDGVAGFPETAAVIEDDAMTCGEKHRNLLFPGSTVERISMNQNHRMARTVILIVKLDVRGIFLTDSDVRHNVLLPQLLVMVGCPAGCAALGAPPSETAEDGERSQDHTSELQSPKAILCCLTL